MQVINREPADEKVVYDIGIPEYHNFILGNGLVAKNCFGKAHSISYSFLSYLCGYLKANYTAEFFCALMGIRSQVMAPEKWASKAPLYVDEASRLGVDILGPSINESKMGFSIHDNEVYFGLSAVRNVGSKAARSIIRARGNAKFKNVLDFLFRVDLSMVNTRVFESLVKAGAFDKMGYRRKDLLEAKDGLYDHVRGIAIENERKQEIKEREAEIERVLPLIEKKKKLRRLQRTITTRDLTVEEELWMEEHGDVRKPVSLKPKPAPEPPELERHTHLEFSLRQIIEQAKYIGCFLLEHPAKVIFPGATPIESVTEEGFADISGSVVEKKEIKDKKGHKMAFIKVGDGTDFIECVIFSSVYRKLTMIPEEWDIVKVSGKVDMIEPVKKILVNSIETRRTE